MTMWAFLKWTTIVLALLVVGVVLFIAVFDWNWARGIVASKASQAIGHTVTIAGDLDMDWSWPPTIRVDNIRVANAAWSPEPYMLTLRQLVLQIDLRALLRGRLVLPMIELQEPVIRLESSTEGQLNWFVRTRQAISTPAPPQEATPPTWPTIGQVTLHNGHIIRHDYSTDATSAGTLHEVRAQTVGPEQSIEVRGTGQFEHTPFQLTVQAGALPTLQTNDPYPLQVQLTVDEWYTRLAGTIHKPLELAGMDLAVLLEKSRAPDQTATADASAAQQPLHRLTGHLSRQDDAWEVAGLQGTLGKSDISAGHLVLTIQDKRPLLQAELTSNTLDVDNLIDTLTDPRAATNKPDTEPDDPASGPLIDVEITRAINLMLHFQGQRVIVAGQTLDNVAAVAELQDGHFTFKPTLALAGGNVTGMIDVKAQDDVFQSVIHADIDRVDLRQILARLNQDSAATGIVNGGIDLTVSGRTFSDLLTSLTGKAWLSMTDKATDTDVTVNFATLEGDIQTAARQVTLEGGGRMRGQPVQLTGRVGALHAWQAGAQPYPIQASVQLGETQIQIDGTLKHPRQFTSIDAKVALQGPDPATLAAFLPVSLPHLPAYQFAGQLERTEQRWRLKSFKGALGHSDLAGTLALELDGARPFLRGALRSQHLRLDELMATMAQNKAPEAAQQASSPPSVQGEVQRAIPDVPFNPELLQRLDADLRFQGQDIRTAKLSLRNVAVAVHMENGHLKLTPSGELDGGTMRATIEARSRQAQLAGRIQTEVKQVDLNRVLSKFELEREAFGQVDGHIDLTGQGQSLATWLASANGDVSLTMAGGQLHGLLIELVGLDVGESIVAAFAGKEARVPIRCLLADFIVSDGRMQTQMLVFDTSDTKIISEGFIDLGQELVDIKLVPEAKDFSLFSAESPMYLRGPMTNLSAGPKIGEVLLSLAMPIKVGKPENVDCQALFEATHKQREPPQQ
jgi:uncharacterized protein involved in outer membrane biogenesis